MISFKQLFLRVTYCLRTEYICAKTQSMSRYICFCSVKRLIKAAHKGQEIIFGIDEMTTLFDLHGKTAIITGASSGLGEQFARSLSGAGARVILAARRIDKLNTLAAELNNARAIQMDVSDKQSVKSCFAELDQAGERIDICVNNAGIAILTPIFDEDDNDNFESIVQTNLMGVWHVTKAVANHMKNRGIHGSIRLLMSAV